jgi:hypothetical protein
MLNDYSKRAKTAQIRINDIENHFQGHKRNICKKMYKNKSPAIFNHYRQEEPNHEQYIKHMHYIKPQRNTDNYHDEEKLERTMKNMGAKGSYFHNEFRNMNISVERDNNLTQKANYTFTNQNQDKLNERYINLEKKNINKNNILSENEKIIINYKKIYEKQKYEGREGKYPPKFYKNKVKKEKRENVIEPVAQKICNIIIKGETKNKKLTTVSKSGKKFVNNIIEENVSQGSTVPDIINTFNLNSKKNNHIQNFQKINPKKNNEKNENEEIIESEERTITISDSKREVYRNNKKKIKNNIEREREENYEDYEEQEENIKNNNDEYYGHPSEEPYIEGEGENEEENEQEDQVQVAQEERHEQDEEIEEDHKQAEELLVDEENKEEKKDNNDDENEHQYNNENENDNEEENQGINEGDIDKLEEVEIQQIEIHNNNNNRKEKKNNILQLQKGDEIELEAIK